MNTLKKVMCGVTSILCAASFAGSAWTASAVTAEREEMFPSANAGISKTMPAIRPVRAHAAAPAKEVDLPASFDLRDVDGMNFVTPVKSQGELGTCWAFGNISALETAMLSNFWKEQGIRPENIDLDLSERHLAWFQNTPLPEDNRYYPAQAGEGQAAINGVSPMNTGGVPASAASMLAAGIGPYFERDCPYRNEEGLWLWVRFHIAEDEDGSRYATDIEYLSLPFDFDPESVEDDYTYRFCECYSAEGDWSVPEQYRFNFDNNIIGDITVLPCPAMHNENFEYIGYDENATTTMKEAIVSGHGIAISYYSDDMFTSENYAHYEYIPDIDADHAVCIVGYDDNYSRENFLQGTDEETGLDRTPPADGAWIVKNSWGAADQEIPNSGDWGVDGSGYFYLSYYDMSLVQPTIYDISNNSHDATAADYQGLFIEQSDLMPPNDYQSIEDENEILAANIFTAEQNEAVYELGVYINNYNTDVELYIFEMDENTTVPTAGKLLGTASGHHENFGFYREKLAEPVYIPAGTKYAVVAKEQSNGKYVTAGAYNLNENITEFFTDFLGMEDYVLWTAATGIVNPGESMLFYQGEWLDLTDFRDTLNDLPYEDYEHLDADGNPTILGYCYDCLVVDNFPIKAYVELYGDSSEPETTTEPVVTTTVTSETSAVTTTATQAVSTASSTTASSTTETQAVTTADSTGESTTTTETTTTYSVDQLKEMAIHDYEQKNDVRPDSAEATENEDGTVTITLYQTKDGKKTVLDVYTIDPVTGIGTDKAGAEVNLPQTGNNAPGTAGAAAGAFLMIGAGLFLTAKSGILRKKDNEE